jgi:16S rRNA processing protein RimM
LTPTSPTDHSPKASDDDSVVVGRVVGAWGIQGDLKVQSLTDVPERLSEGGLVYMDGRPARIERAKPTKAGLRLKLDIVADRTQAETLRGAQLTVPRSEVRPAPDGTFYHFQIIGIEVFTEEEERLGQVLEILDTGGNDVYVIGRPDDKDLLLPAIADVVLSIDVDRNRMTVRVPEGLG